MMPGVVVEVSSREVVPDGVPPTVNVREERAGTGVTAVCEVEGTGVLKSARVLATVADDIIFGVNEAGRLVVERPDGKPVLVSNMPDAAVTAAVAVSRETVLIMTADGRRHWAFIGAGVDIVSIDDCPDMFLSAAPASTLRSFVDIGALAGGYSSRQATVTDRDTRTISTTLDRAFERLAEEAMASGYLPGTVIAVCEVYGPNDLFLARTAPVLLCDPGEGVANPIFTAEATVDETGRVTVGGAWMGINALSVTLNIPTTATADLMRTKIDHVDVLMTPPLTPVKPGGVCDAVLTDFGGNACRLRASLPGLSLAGDVEMTRQHIAAALARLDGLLMKVATIPGNRLSEKKISITPRFGATYASARDTALRRLNAPVEAPLPGAGPDWSAATIARLDDILVAADITRRPASVFSPLHVAATTEATSWRGYSMIEIADGSERQTVVNDVAASADCPTAFSPLIVYPGAHATRAVIRTNAATGLVDVPLSATADGRYSYYLSPDLRPIAGRADSSPFIVPAAKVTPTRSAGGVLLSMSRNPADILAVTEITGAVTAIVEPVNGGSTLDFGRTRCYLTASSGIYSLAVNSGRNRVKTERLDRRSVQGPEAVTRVPGALRLIAGGDLVAVSGNRVTTIERGVNATAIGHSRHFDESWLAMPDGRVAVLTPGGRFYWRTDIAPCRFVDFDSWTMAVDAAGGAFNIDSERESTPAGPVHWMTRLPAMTLKRGDRFTLNIGGDGLDLIVSLWSDGRLVDRLAVTGNIYHPVSVPVIFPILKNGRKRID